MNRNKNVDILRVAAILVIMVYHAYVICGMPWTARTYIHTLLNFGGELGVTLFFALSGFGIYMSLDRKHKAQALPTWWSFMKARCKRIMPQYYFCIFVLLLFPSAHLLSVEGLKHIGAYIFFIQNLFLETHGSINGALWTMATIFQFYLIAKWLYLMMNKHPFVGCIGAAALTVGSKMIIYNYVLPCFDFGGSGYFVYGRQLISALDNFVFGMAAAKIINSEWLKEKNKNSLYILGTVLTLCSLVLLVITTLDLSVKGPYGGSIRGYAGHTWLAFLFALLIVGISMMPQIKGGLSKIVQFLAKYQYGIYLWHMPVIVSLKNSSPLFQYLAIHNFSVFAIALIMVIIGIGYLTSKGIDMAFAHL